MLTENPAPETKPAFFPRQAAPREWFRAGFFAALGVAVLFVLALAVRRLFTATLAVALPFLLGGGLALLLDPLADRLERRGLSRLVAASIVFVGLLLLLAGIGYLVVPALVSQATALAAHAPQYISSVQDSVNQYLTRHRHFLTIKLPPNYQVLSAEISGQTSALLQRSAGGVTGFLLGSVTMIIQLVLALIITFFLLLDIDRLRARLFYLAPERWRRPMGQLGNDIGGVFSEYIRGLLVVCVLYGIATILMLYALSALHHSLAQYALLIGAAAGVLYLVPYVGSTTTALVTFLVAFAAGGAGFGGLAVALTLALNQVFDNVVTPKVVGGGVGLNPVVALFALVLGGEMFGLWGMLLSVPVAASVQVVLFRLFPKLITPTPEPFLRAQGVPPDEEESAKIVEGDRSLTAQRQEQEQRQQERHDGHAS